MTSASSALASRPLPPRLSALLLAHVTGRSREWIIAHPEAELTAEQRRQFEALVADYQRGAPLPYLLGRWEFFGLDFKITPEVLVPRPETELLVETALRSPKARIQNPDIADIGTGSGVIAVTLALKLPGANVVAADISPAALDTAKANAEAHGVRQRITFIHADLLSAFIFHRSSFDLICANLPYIPTAELATLDVAKREPRAALDGGPDGLDLIRRLLADAPRALKPGGAILLEIGAAQGEAAAAMAKRYFPSAAIEVHKDLAGLDRLLTVQTHNPG